LPEWGWHDGEVSLAILHREPGVEPLVAGQPVWRTCLREVEFVGVGGYPQTALAATAGQPLEEGAAYQLLLEILCGLQSPMIGETQVLGQFKCFLGGIDREHGWLGRVGQRLLSDAREVRTKHLQGLGCRSYGSAVRRDLADVSHAVVIGTGKLAHEVLPFLADNGRTVDQWGRADSGDVETIAGATYHRLQTMADAAATPINAVPTAMIVAAPVTVAVIEAVAARYSQLRRVIDLRADVGERALAVACEIIALQDLFARMHDEHAAALPRIEAARKDIAWRTRQYELRDELRPFGWDDLCA
jgi:glutamyl-tRNA reductase